MVGGDMKSAMLYAASGVVVIPVVMAVRHVRFLDFVLYFLYFSAAVAASAHVIPTQLRWQPGGRWRWHSGHCSSIDTVAVTEVLSEDE